MLVRSTCLSLALAMTFPIGFSTLAPVATAQAAEITSFTPAASLLILTAVDKRVEAALVDASPD